MKSTVIALVALSSCLLNAQSAEQKAKASETPCVFDVKPQSSKGTQEGSYARTKSKALSFKAFVRSNAKEDVSFSLETIYMAVKDKRTIPFSRDEFFFSLEPGASTNIVFQSPMLESTEYDRWYGGNTKTGFKILGAIARLKRDGIVVKNYCSNYAWKKIAWNPSIDVESENVQSQTPTTYRESEQLRASRLASSEHVDLSKTKTDVSAAFFRVKRMSDPVRLRATASIADVYLDDFGVWRKSHVCIRLAAAGESQHFYFYSYARKGEAVAQKALDLLKDGEGHEVLATLHYPRQATSSSCCYLDAIEPYTAEEEAKPAEPQQGNDTSVVFFKAERLREPTVFSAEVGLSSEFYGSPSFRQTHWCLEVRVSERKASRTLTTTLHALLKKDSPEGARLIKILKDGELHKGQAVLRYPDNPDDRFSCCLLDDFIPEGASLGGQSVLQD